jgi:hypothetical protein
MTERQTQFDEYFKEDGGIYLVPNTPLGAEMAALLAVLRNAIDEEKKINDKFPVVYLDFINDTSVNASAGIDDDGTYFIGVNFGVYNVLRGIFSRMLCCKNVLPEYGDVGKLTEPKKLAEPHLVDSILLSVQAGNEMFPVPGCEIRNAVSHALLYLTMLGVVMHEYSHILNGHIDLMEAQMNLRVRHEASKKESCEALATIYEQTIEMDADCGSVTMSFDYIDRHINQKDLFSEEFTSFFNAHSKWDVYKLWLFGNYTFWRIFGEDYQDLTKNHPPSGIRQSTLVGTIAEMFLNSPDIKAMATTLANIAVDVELAFNQISEKETTLETFLNAYSPEFTEQQKRYSEEWSKLRPELEKFSYVELAPVTPWLPE